MKMFRTLMLVCSLFSFTGLLIAHDTYSPGNPLGNPYETGYVRGYQHGSQDIQARVNFDYRHAYEYQATESQHMSYDTNGNCDLRVGYIEGYVDGYFRHAARVQANDNYGYSGNNGYEYNGNGYSGRQDASVTAFTKTRFSGYSQQFGIGQYPNLEGEMHDNIDSLLVRGNVRVILFDDRNFGGKRVIVDRNAADLYNFKGKAASMIVESFYESH